MKMILVSLALMIMWSPAFAQTQSASHEAVVQAWEWAYVKNLEPVTSEHNSYVYGGLCAIERGGKLIRIGRVYASTFLVRYTAPDKAVARGECPTGTIFFIGEYEFNAMIPPPPPHVAKEKKAKEKAYERRRIAKALKDFERQHR